MTRSVTNREPEWTDQDRAEALALAMYRDSLCPNGCGQPLDESTSHYEAGPAYDVKHTTCRACSALVEAKRAAKDRGKTDDQARVWRLIKD